MDIDAVVNDALKYPYQSLPRVLILGAVPLGALLIALVVMLLLTFTSSDLALAVSVVVGSALLFISGLFVAGYFIRVIESSLNGEDDLPDFSNQGELLVNGLKLLVVQVVYLLIPTLVIILCLWIIYSASVHSILVVIMLTSILVILLLFLFSMFLIMATAHLAATGSIKEALRFSVVQQKIATIGWGTYTLWYLLMLVLGMVGVVAMAFISIIPILGSFVGWVLVQPYLEILLARSVALVYLSAQ
ncbi:MAG: DUF4013 domain-containing protein [Methanobacteriaceae archaeon]